MRQCLQQRTSEQFRPWKFFWRAGRFAGLCSIAALFVTAATASPFVYVATGQGVAVIDVATGLPVTTIPTGSTPNGIALNPAGTRAYVANYELGSSNATVIDTLANTVVTNAAVGTRASAVAVHPDGSRAYIVNSGDNTVSVIDTATNTVSNTITVGNYPVAIAINPAGTRLYVPNFNGSNVSVIDATSNTLLTSFSTATSPNGVAFHPDGTRAYVTNFDNGELRVVDALAHGVSNVIRVGVGPIGVAVNPAGTKAYVANANANTVSVVNLSPLSITATIAVGAHPVGVAVTPDGTRAYVTNYNGDSISVIDTASDVVLGTLPVGLRPYGIAVGGPVTYTVTPSAGANGSISPSAPRTAGAGATLTFTMAPASGYSANVGGTCGGSLINNIFTTNPVTISCSVDATFTPAVATAIAAGRYHTCAVVGGGVRCWGGNQSIQLGTSLGTTNIPIATIPLGSGATAIAAGDSHTCAVVQGGVRCWGSNNSGQIAGGSGSFNAVSFPVQTIPAGSGATAVAAGAFHSCAVVNGGVLCWGDNRSGQLGTGDTQQPLSPAQVIPAGGGVVTVAAGQTQTCAVFSSGLVKCWGTFLNGDTFQGRQIPSTILSPIGMAYGSSVAAAVGFNHACTAGTGGVRCAGINEVGQLGVTGLLDNPAPGVALAGNSISVGAGNSDTCAEFNGGVKCWGLGFYGALGNGTSGAAAMSDIPVDAILAGNGVSAVAVGVFHVCAIANGAVKCWGYNSSGQLGDASNLDRATPVAVNLFPAPVFLVSPPTLSFSANVGFTSAVQTVTVSNPGTASLNLFSFVFTSNFARAMGADAGTCATFAPMSPSASCTIGIVFSAPLAGASSGTLSILHNAPGSPTAITLNGSGIPPVSALIGVVSRKDHGNAGTFDLVLDTGVPISGAITVEPRLIGTQHRIVFAFNAAVTAQGSVTVVNAAGQTVPANLSASAGEVVVSLPNVPDNSRVFITLSGVNGSTGGTVAIGFLVGDVNNSRSVTLSDISAVKARSGQATTASNFKFDVNASGAINSSDILAVKARSGLTLP